MDSFVIEDGAPHQPEGLVALAEEASAEGIRNVSVLVSRWADQSERYEQPGESVLVARSGTGIVGVGGLTECPHVPGAMRVRRFFVSSVWRRHGVARSLAAQLIDTGLEQSNTLTCNAGASDAAIPFWESLGFEPVEIEGITHLLTRPSTS